MIYKAHTSKDNFSSDMITVFKINKENKLIYLMGDFNIDLLEDDIDRPTQDYLDLIYAQLLIPTINKPTRITATSATLIDKY